MPAPVIADVFRIVMEWQGFAGVTPVNVFHVRGSGATVSDVADAVNAGFVAGDAAGNMWEPLTSDIQATAFSVQPLDGATAATDHAITSGNQVGGCSGAPAPAVSAVVSLKTAQLGARGRGRVYVGPLGEGGMANGILDTGIASTCLAGWGAFITSVEGDITDGLVVASYTHADAHKVLTVRVDSVLGTQRRRQDQLR